MATINDLHTSISQLPRGEAMQLIYDIRASRRVVKKKGKPTKKKAKRIKDPMAMFKAMSQEERDKLIQMLEEEV